MRPRESPRCNCHIFNLTKFGRVFLLARVAGTAAIGKHRESAMLVISRRMALLGTAALAGLIASAALADGPPPLKAKATYKVGFAQTESNNPWRLAQTASMKAEAEKLGWQLVYTDAAGSAAKQVADVNSMIAQGVDAIFLSPPRRRA